VLSHRFRVPADWDESRRHQLELWTAFLGHFGLTESPDLSPLAPPPAPGADAPIGLIVGSENFPAKRWPVPHWRTLIEALPDQRFELFGTPGDRPLAAAVAAGWPPERVRNRAGETDLPGFATALGACRLLVTNDTGGMHLANALGVPVLALFGPTNPIRTGPVFASPHRVLQPPGCPPTGGGDLVQLAPATVAAAVREMLPISGGRFPS
jgi:ADP-heptose:LPS heptosyltransferase